MVATTSRPARRFARHHNHRNDPRPSTTPNTKALRVGTAWRARGRSAVRFITLSMSASTTQLSAFALAAPIHPPNRCSGSGRCRRCHGRRRASRELSRRAATRSRAVWSTRYMRAPCRKDDPMRCPVVAWREPPGRPSRDLLVAALLAHCLLAPREYAPSLARSRSPCRSDAPLLRTMVDRSHLRTESTRSPPGITLEERVGL